MDNKNNFYMDKRQVASAFKVHIRTISEWQAQSVDPLPIFKKGKVGKPNIYYLPEVCDWFFRNTLRKTPIDKFGSEEHKADYLELLQEHSELRCKVLRGEPV